MQTGFITGERERKRKKERLLAKFTTATSYICGELPVQFDDAENKSSRKGKKSRVKYDIGTYDFILPIFFLM